MWTWASWRSGRRGCSSGRLGCCWGSSTQTSPCKRSSLTLSKGGVHLGGYTAGNCLRVWKIKASFLSESRLDHQNVWSCCLTLIFLLGSELPSRSWISFPSRHGALSLKRAAAAVFSSQTCKIRTNLICFLKIVTVWRDVLQLWFVTGEVTGLGVGVCWNTSDTPVVVCNTPHLHATLVVHKITDLGWKGPLSIIQFRPHSPRKWHLPLVLY